MNNIIERINFSLIELLAVLLPGAVITYLLFANKCAIEKLLEINHCIKSSETESYLVYIICSYVIGNILFYIGTYLDSGLYELYYNYYPDEDLKKLHSIVSIRKTEILGFDNRAVFNNHKWAMSMFLLKNESMNSDVQRYIAASKFFRTLILPSLFLGVFCIIKDKILAGLLLELLTLISILIYFDQRKKSIRASLEHVLVLTSEMK